MILPVISGQLNKGLEKILKQAGLHAGISEKEPKITSLGKWNDLAQR